MSVELFNVLSYHHQIVENVDITTTDPDWTDLISLTAVDMSVGTYALSASIQFHQNSTSQDFLYQFSYDGEATWGPVYMKRVKGRNNIEVLEIFDVLDLPSVETIQVACRVSRSATADTTVIKAILACERKA